MKQRGNNWRYLPAGINLRGPSNRDGSNRNCPNRDRDDEYSRGGGEIGPIQFPC